MEKVYIVLHVGVGNVTLKTYAKQIPCVEEFERIVYDIKHRNKQTTAVKERSPRELTEFKGRKGETFFVSLSESVIWYEDIVIQ